MALILTFALLVDLAKNKQRKGMGRASIGPHSPLVPRTGGSFARRSRSERDLNIAKPHPVFIGGNSSSQRQRELFHMSQANWDPD